MSEFKDITEGIQAIMISVGVLIGGAWALYQFFSLNTIDKAKLELEKFKKELLERACIIIDLGITQLKNDSKTILVKVNLQNIGNRTEVIDWIKSKVTVAKIELQEDNELIKTDLVELKLHSVIGAWNRSTLNPSAKNEYSYIVKLSEPGLYIFELDIHGSLEEITLHLENAINSGLKIGDSHTLSTTYSTIQYFEVE